jgi:hypothetical protein
MNNACEKLIDELKNTIKKDLKGLPPTAQIELINSSVDHFIKTRNVYTEILHWLKNEKEFLLVAAPNHKKHIITECPVCYSTEYTDLHYDMNDHSTHCTHCGWDSASED